MKTCICSFLGKTTASSKALVESRIKLVADGHKVHNIPDPMVFTSAKDAASLIKKEANKVHVSFKGVAPNVYEAVEKLLESYDVVFLSCARDPKSMNSYFTLAGNLMKAHPNKRVVVF